MFGGEPDLRLRFLKGAILGQNKLAIKANAASANEICSVIFAVKENKIKALVYLVEEAGAEIDEQDLFGDTPLHYAVRHKNKEAVEKLLELGANPYIENLFGKTAFQTELTPDIEALFVLHENREAELDILFLLGQAVNDNDYNSVDIYMHLLAESDVFVENLLIGEQSLLLYAGLNGKDQAFKALLEYAKYSEQSSVFYNNLFVQLAANPDSACFKELVKKFSNFIDENSRAAIHHALLRGDTQAFSILLDHLPSHIVFVADKFGISSHDIMMNGATTGVSTVEEQTRSHLRNGKDRSDVLLGQAIRKGTAEETVQLLMKTPKCVLERYRYEKSESTYLHVAIRRNDKLKVLALLASGAKIGIPNSSGENELHIACKRGASKVLFLLLISWQVDLLMAREEEKNITLKDFLNMIDPEGRRPIDIAREQGNDVIEDLILSIMKNSSDLEGRRPIGTAHERGNNVVKDLRKSIINKWAITPGMNELIDVILEARVAVHMPNEKGSYTASWVLKNTKFFSRFYPKIKDNLRDIALEQEGREHNPVNVAAPAAGAAASAPARSVATLNTQDEAGSGSGYCAGAGVSAADSAKTVFYSSAVSKKYQQFFRRLVRMSTGELNEQSSHRLVTFLHDVIYRQNCFMVFTLLASGARLGILNNHGENELHTACRRNSGAVVFLLIVASQIDSKKTEGAISLKALLSQKDIHGKTPLDVAKERQKGALIELLESAERDDYLPIFKRRLRLYGGLVEARNAFYNNQGKPYFVASWLLDNFTELKKCFPSVDMEALREIAIKERQVFDSQQAAFSMAAASAPARSVATSNTQDGAGSGSGYCAGAGVPVMPSVTTSASSRCAALVQRLERGREESATVRQPDPKRRRLNAYEEPDLVPVAPMVHFGVIPVAPVVAQGDSSTSYGGRGTYSSAHLNPDSASYAGPPRGSSNAR